MKAIKQKIRYVLLDLGGVVFGSTGTTNAQIDWAVISKLNAKWGHRLNLGEDLFLQFMDDYNRQTNQNLVRIEFLKAVFDTLVFNEELVQLVKSHAEIIILSDNYRENIAYVSLRYQFESWASRQLYSFQAGMTKSDPRFFKWVIDQLGIAPEDLLFIDDDPNNIKTAAECGIKGIKFVNNDQLRREFFEVFSKN